MVDRDVPALAVARWAEAVAAIGRTGMAFTENPYDVERYEELLHIAGDMLASIAGHGFERAAHVEQWHGAVTAGPAGYVTPKVAVGAFVADEQGRLLLIQRSDSHLWFIPTGWSDVGYSPAEVVAKEVMEETGIEAEVDRVAMVFDGMRGGSPVPHYVVVFACRAVGGQLHPHPQECDDAGWFARDELPSPLFNPDLWVERAFAAIDGTSSDVWFDPPRPDVWRPSPSQDSDV